MASSQPMNLSRRITTPIELYWVRDESDEEAPRINVDHDELRDTVFEGYDVESVEGLAKTVLSEYERRQLKQRQLGVIVGDDEDVTFVREADALATVDGIDDEVATHLVEWFGDIPELCREMRRDQYLSALEHDAYVEADTEAEAAWVEEIAAGPEFERSLKKAGVWT